MAIIEDPRNHLSNAAFTVRKWHRVLLQDEDNVTPVDPAEVFYQANPTAGHPWSPWEGALARLHCGQEANFIDVW